MKKLMLIMIPFACFAGEVRYPKAATYFVAYDSNGLRHIGITETNQVTVSGQPEFYASAFDAEFLSAAKTIGIPDTYNPLPTMSNMVAKGIYSYEGGLVICRQDHTRTEHLPSEVPALFSVYRGDAEGMAWIANEPVKAGNVRVYDGKTYTCLQPHTTQVDWTPALTVGTLWKLTAPPVGEWVQPGSTNPYMLGDRVLFGGKVYESKINNNVWSPSAYPAGWKLVN